MKIYVFPKATATDELWLTLKCENIVIDQYLTLW